MTGAIFVEVAFKLHIQFLWQVQYFIFHGRRVIWSSSRVASLAPRNVSDVSCVTTVKHECRPSVVLCMPEVAPRNVLDRVLRLSNGL